MTDKMSLARRVQDLREQRDWTREELAARAGLHYSHIGQIERGERPNPRRDTLTKIAKALDVTVEYLVSGTSVSASMENDMADYQEVVRFATDNGVSPTSLLNLLRAAIAIHA